MSFFAELTRRNVFRAAAGYLAVAWLLVEVSSTLLPLFGLGDDTVRLLVIVLAIGFVPAMIVAWVFELTPEGLKRDADVDHDAPATRRLTRRLDRLVLLALALAVGFFAFDKFVLDPARDAEELATAIEQGKEAALIEVAEARRDASIAVLPFQDLSPDGDQAYFAEGLAVDLMTQLGSVPALRVTGKTSAFSFQGTPATIPEIGTALNVAHVLDGTVTKLDDRVRISVQLIDARQDSQLWSQTYEQPLRDIFDIRDDITARIFDRLTIKFEDMRQASRSTDPEVYDLTLQARRLLASPGPDEAEETAALLERALASDPNYVPALLEATRANYYRLHYGLITAEEEDRVARERIERVLAIEPDNGTALMHLAWGDWETQMDLESAARKFSQALQSSPGDLEAARGAALFARAVGRHEASIALLKRCVAADPRNPQYAWHLVLSYLWAGRLDDAMSAFRRYEALGGKEGDFYLLVMLLLRGEAEQAEAILNAKESQDHPMFIAARAMVMHDLGRADVSAEALAQLPMQIDRGRRNHAYLVAQAYAWTGQNDEAFEWLEKAYELDERYGHHGFWFQRIMFLPIWQKLHDDPRWTELRERMNFSAARLEALEFAIPSWVAMSVEQI